MSSYDTFSATKKFHLTELPLCSVAENIAADIMCQKQIKLKLWCDSLGEKQVEKYILCVLDELTL